jgi:uncharacterized protein
MHLRAALVVLTVFAAHAQTYARADEMIPMRDGVKLYTQVFTPNNSTEKLPFVLIRTPYGTGQLDSARLIASLPELAAEGFMFVMQDIPGRFKSDGQFVMLRPRRQSDRVGGDGSSIGKTREVATRGGPT